MNDWHTEKYCERDFSKVLFGYKQNYGDFGYYEFDMRYVVSFYEDKAKGLKGFTPLIEIDGKIEMRTLRDIITSVEDKSGGDKAMTGEI